MALPRVPRDRVSPREFKNLVKRLGGKPYLPKKITDELRQSKASQFFWRSATKRQTERTVQRLRGKKLVAPKFLQARFTPKRLVRETMQTSAAPPPNRQLLGTGRLPGKIRTEKFLEYYGQLTGRGQDAKTALRELNLVGQEFLSKRQQVTILSRLRDQGQLTRENIGADIQRAERRREAFVKEGISAEQTDQGGRYVAAAENLPEGIVRSIGRPAAGTAQRAVAGTPERASSVSRLAAIRGDAADLEEHATTASALARGKSPREPKTSAARGGKTQGPAAAPELMDLPLDDE